MAAYERDRRIGVTLLLCALIALSGALMILLRFATKFPIACPVFASERENIVALPMAFLGCALFLAGYSVSRTESKVERLGLSAAFAVACLICVVTKVEMTNGLHADRSWLKEVPLLARILVDGNEVAVGFCLTALVAMRLLKLEY